MADKHILRIHDTQANLLNDLKDTQIAWATDTEEAIWRDGNNFHFIGSGKYWDGSQFVFDNIDVGEVSFFDKTAGSILGKLTADGGNFTINFNGVDISIDASSLDLTSVTSVTANDPTLAQEVATKNYVDLNAVNIPTPALNGSFLVKNTNGTFTMLDGVSAPPFVWDAINTLFTWQGQLDFTGSHNYKNGSLIQFLDSLGVGDSFISNTSGGDFQISSSSTSGGTKNIVLTASGDIVFQTIGKVDVQNDIEVAGDTTLTNLPTGTQVGLVGYDSAGKLIQGASSGGTQDLDSVLTQGNTTGTNKISFQTYNNSVPSLGDVWSDGQELRGYQRGNQDNAAFDQNIVGASVFLLTTQDVNKCPFGFSQIANSTATNLPNGWETSGVSNVITFGHEPNSTTISQIISSNNRVAQRSTRTGAWTELSLRVEASTNPSTMAVDASLYKQISANNLAQTCTIPLPTNGVDGSKVIYRFRASATSNLSWNAGFNDLKGALPTSIAINKSLYVGVIYDAFTSTWDVVSVVEQN